MTTGKIFVYPNTANTVDQVSTSTNYGRELIIGPFDRINTTTLPTQYADATTPLYQQFLNPTPNAFPSNLPQRDIGMYFKKNKQGADFGIEQGIAKPEVLQELVGTNVATNFPAVAGDGILLYSSLNLGGSNTVPPDEIEAWSTQAGIFAIDVLMFKLPGGCAITQHTGFTSFILDGSGKIIGVNYNTAIVDPVLNNSIVVRSRTLANANQKYSLSMITSEFPFAQTTQDMHFLVVARYLANPVIAPSINEDTANEVRAIIHTKEPDNVRK